jgi:2,4-dienoyl-CoA reductase-like NADH-dependent reductase (Old Yellow Enzyme family)
MDILTALRGSLPPSFVIGLKLNSADYVSGGLSILDARDHISQLARGGIDFIEISGGDYEQPGLFSYGLCWLTFEVT